MQIGEGLIWYSLSGVCLLIAAAGIVFLGRALGGQPLYTDRDSHALLGITNGKALTVFRTRSKFDRQNISNARKHFKG
jgi:hypothetical protein